MSETPHWNWIASPEELERRCDQWSRLDFLPLDTEFIRTKSFRAVLGLVQVGAEDGCYLLDPLEIPGLPSLANCLSGPAAPTAVIHACSEDLEVLRLSLGVLPARLFDTQVAAALVGFDFSIGYQRLLRELLGIEIPKGESRSNWLARPLENSQLRYAALDVVHLSALHGELAARLEAMGRRHWLAEDCAELLARAATDADPALAYLGVSGAQRLRGQQVVTLQALAAWRERTAIARDLPRKWVFDDRTLLSIARARPADAAALKALALGRRLRRDADSLLECVRAAEGAPVPPLPPRLAPGAGPLVERVRAVVKGIADELQVVPEVLARRAMIQQLVTSGWNTGRFSLPDGIGGWRRELLGERLLAATTEGWHSLVRP